LFDRVAFQQHSGKRHYGIQGWPTREYGFGPAPGGFHALAKAFAFDLRGAIPRNASGIGAITDFLSLVFAQQ
jgi:hypothetical protein